MIPQHLVPEVAAYERGDLDGEPDQRIRLYADLLVAGAVPESMAAAVQAAVADGWLSPAGDVLRYGDDVVPGG